jgi:hypothetical protein
VWEIFIRPKLTVGFFHATGNARLIKNSHNDKIEANPHEKSTDRASRPLIDFSIPFIG